MKNKQIKYVLLDLGGVAFEATGVSNDKINWEVITKLNYRYGHDLNIGKDKFGDFMRDYNELTNQKLSGAVFLEAIFDTIKFNQELVDLIKVKYPIIIVSDNYRENITYISKRYHFDQWSIRQFYSFDFEMEKANPKFFIRLLEELKIDAEELLFIDDSPSKIESAKQNGIEGILYKNVAEIRKVIDY